MPAIRKRTKKKPAVRRAVKIAKRKPRVSVSRKDLETLRRAARQRAAEARIVELHRLRRHEANPIIAPREENFWEMKATFNPGALYADRRVHLLYRAIGGDDVSVLGYAASSDGTSFEERLHEPAFAPTAMKKEKPQEPADLSKLAYCSGGGWNGGCEDPRLTLLEDRVYLMYTAFDGWGSVRIALSSIGLGDFLEKRWKWKAPALISPPGEIHKNWVMFPEKINGKFAILHSISPVVEIAYFDTLEELESGTRQIESHYNRVSRTGGWDSSVRGAGPPPIRTRLGWLLFYHAMDVRDPDRYKVGAMILDVNDPTRVLYRSKAPILEPDAAYENAGFKAGVVYACGAVIKDGELYLYYGGSDSVTCLAMANVDTFLDTLAKHGAPKLAVRKPMRR